jgi:hypothetical protein
MTAATLASACVLRQRWVAAEALGSSQELTVGALAVMNKACKSSQHAWCAPIVTVGTT